MRPSAATASTAPPSRRTARSGMMPPAPGPTVRDATGDSNGSGRQRSRVDATEALSGSRPSRTSASSSGRKGSAGPYCSMHCPRATRHGAVGRSPRKASTREVFPMPASPVTNTTWRTPLAACASHDRSCVTSASRPTKMDSGCRGAAGVRAPPLLSAPRVHHAGDPSIAATVHGLDEPRGAPGIAEDLPQLVHASDEHVLGHVDLRPDLLEQLVLGHQPARPGRQILEDGERLATQGNDLVVAVQTGVRCIEREGRKPEHVRPPGRRGHAPVYLTSGPPDNASEKPAARPRNAAQNCGMIAKCPQDCGTRLWTTTRHARAHVEIARRPPRSQTLLPRGAFLIECRSSETVSDDRLSGRVEHIVSGKATSFECAGTLIDFIRRVLRRVDRSPAAGLAAPDCRPAFTRST